MTGRAKSRDEQPVTKANLMSDTITPKHSKLFGFITLENIVQFVLLIVAIAIAYTQLSAQVSVLAARQIEMKLAMDKQSETTTNVSSDERASSIVNVQQQAEIHALQQGRDTDRKVLMEINANVAVLLDRSDPHKVKQ